MVEFETTEARWVEDDSGSWISFKVNDRKIALNACKTLVEANAYMVSIKEKKVRRSLDSNAYFHVLVNKIAEKANQSDDDIKKDLVCKYGTLSKDKDGQYIAAKLPDYVNPDDIYPYTRRYKTVKDEKGKEWICYLFYKRTHLLDTKEMSRLIEGTISEAKELGIETATPEELSLYRG